MTLHQRDSATQSLQKKLQKRPGNDQILAGIARLADTAREVKPSELLIYMDDFQAIGTWGHDYQSMKEYDSIQQSLPASKKDGWLKKLWNKRALTLNEKYQKDATASMKQMGDVLLHQIPYLLFLSLPFFALILKLLYVRRKQFYYAEHGIFTVYHYIFSFILLLFVFLLQALEERSSWGIWKILTSITFIIWPVYLFLAMKRFYRQGIWKTFLKFLLLTLLGLLVFILLAAVIFLLSIFQL
jgi:hypothetical protein